MKQLPKYAILTGADIVGIKIISLEYPYLIASVFDYNKEDERVQEYIEDMAQERYPIAKVKGYSIFLKMFTSLESNSNNALQQATLNEMAEYFLDTKIQAKPGLYRRSDESGQSEEKHEFVKSRIMRERRPRIKKD